MWILASWNLEGVHWDIAQQVTVQSLTGDDRLIVLLGGGREILSLADNLSFLLIANDPQ